MENFILEQRTLNDLSGTNSLPIFAGILPGKTNQGISICTEINIMYYLNHKKRLNKNNVMAIRCKNRKRGCGWTGKIVNLSGCPVTSDEYFEKSNWIMAPNSSSQEHTCQGSSVSEVTTRQMMNFVKKKVDERITSLKSINELSGIKRKYGDYGAQLLGDVDRYQRIIQKKRKIDYGGAVPLEFTTMKTFNHDSFSLISENFMHQKTYTYFFLKEFLPLLNTVISCDGTFSCVKNVDGIYQIYIISTQLYDENHTKTHLQPLLMVFLPDKKTATYDKMWTEIKDFFHESTGQNLAPQRLHCDNESAVINTVNTHFPETEIVSCLFHLKNNFLSRLDKIGLKNRSKELVELFTTINGLLFLNLRCNIQFSMAQTFINQIIADIDFLLPKESERPKF